MKNAPQQAINNPKASLHLTHHDHAPVKNMKVGNKVKFIVHGKVKSVNHSDGEGGPQHSAHIEIEDIKDSNFKDKSYSDILKENQEEKEEGKE